jgi:hypothetical protein
VNVVWMEKVTDEEYLGPVAEVAAHDHKQE